MPSSLEFLIEAPFEIPDTIVEVELSDGTRKRVILRDGYARAELAATPRRIALVAGKPPAEVAAEERPARQSMADVPLRPVDADLLYRPGIDLQEGGRLRVELQWGMPCLSTMDRPGEKRFNADEHDRCAELVGLDKDGKKLKLGGLVAPFDKSTVLQVGASKLRFGQIIALAGDLYAHLDDRAVAEFGDAWPMLHGVTGWLAGEYWKTTLAGDSAKAVSDLLQTLNLEHANPGVASQILSTAGASVEGKFPLRRYAALAASNYCHFSCPHAGAPEGASEAMALYRRYHRRAKEEAVAAAKSQAGLLRALVTDAFGWHFLTDQFAAGHMRTPRRLLARLGVLEGSLYMSKRMHDEDNERGLWCRPVSGKGAPWRAYGDGKLLSEDAEYHLSMVREAVRRSAAEVFAVFMGVQAPESVEDLVPMPLAPGTKPAASEQALGKGPIVPNHFPLYWFGPGDAIWVRTGGPDENAYRPYDAALATASALSFPA